MIVAPAAQGIARPWAELYNTYLTPHFDAATTPSPNHCASSLTTCMVAARPLWIAPMQVTRTARHLQIFSDGRDGSGPGCGRLPITPSREASKIALYPHAGFWMERWWTACGWHPLTALVWAPLQLCHWLRVEGVRRSCASCQGGVARLFFVSINGADAGDTQKPGLESVDSNAEIAAATTWPGLSDAASLHYTGPVGLPMLTTQRRPAGKT